MKEKFIWTPEYGVGVKSIDEQHQHFFEIVNRILDLLEKEDISKEEILKPLGELGDYAFYHLKTEENYFDEFNYPDAPAHRQAHDAYRSQVNDYLGRINKEETNFNELAGQMTSFSGSWLFEHILVMDKKYSVFFNKHGLN